MTELTVWFESIVVRQKVDRVLAAMRDVVPNCKSDRLAGWETGHYHSVWDGKSFEIVGARRTGVSIYPSSVSVIYAVARRVGAAVPALV